MALDIDRYAHVDSSIQSWDPRLKIAALGFFVLSVAILKTLPMAISALIAAVIFHRISKLPRHFVMHGMMAAILFLLPFFIILPFTYPTQNQTELVEFSFGWEGFRLACLIFIKAIAIILTSFTIFGSSRFDVSMIALQRLKCPKMLTQMLLFTYRYTYTFLDDMKRMQTSMFARGFVPRANLITLKTYGNFVGTLLVRSFERTERIYHAMLSKGYQGEFHTLVTFKINRKDWLKFCLVVIVVVSLLSGEIFSGFTPAEKGWY